MDNDTNQLVLPPDSESNNNNAGLGKLKDPEHWTTGNEPMTQAQREYLKMLMELHGETFDGHLTKAQAADLIDAKKQNISVSDTGAVQDNLWETFKDPDN